MSDFEKYLDELLSNPEFQSEWDNLESEFNTIQNTIDARKNYKQEGKENGIIMEKSRIKIIMEQYDSVTHKEYSVNIEFWYARELMSLLGYERWENFEKAVVRAMG